MSADVGALIAAFLGSAGGGYIEGRRHKEEKNRLAAEAMLKKQQQAEENDRANKKLIQDQYSKPEVTTVINPTTGEKKMYYSGGMPPELEARMALPGMYGPLEKKAYEPRQVPAGAEDLGYVKNEVKFLPQEKTRNNRLQLKGRTPEGKPVSYDPDTGEYTTGGVVYNGKILPPADKPLDGTTMKSLKDQKTALELLKDAEKTPENVQRKSAGLWGGVGAPLAAKVPLLGKPFRDADRATFQSNVKTGLLKFTYSEAGKQLSDPEREAIKDAIGSIDEPYEVFKPKLDNAIRIISRAQDSYVKGLDEGGFIVPAEYKGSAKKVGRFIVEEE